MSAISKNSPQFKLYQAIFRRNNEAGCLAALNECFPESGTPISFDFRHYTVDGTAIELKSPEDQLKDLFSSLAGVKYLKAMTYLLQAYPQKYGLPRAKDLLFIAITAFCNIRSPDKPYKDFYDLCRQIQITFTSHPLGEDESRVRETFLKFSADFHVIGASLVLAEYPVNRLACVYVRKLEDLESLGINVDDLISETGLLHWIKHSNPLVLENILLKRGWSDTTALIVFGRAVKKNESRLYQLAFQNIEDPNGIFDRVLSRIKVLSDCELGFDYWTNEVPDLISESFCIINACLDSGMKLLPKQKELLCIRLSPSRIKVLVKFKCYHLIEIALTNSRLNILQWHISSQLLFQLMRANQAELVVSLAESMRIGDIERSLPSILPLLGMGLFPEYADTILRIWNEKKPPLTRYTHIINDAISPNFFRILQEIGYPLSEQQLLRFQLLEALPDTITTDTHRPEDNCLNEAYKSTISQVVFRDIQANLVKAVAIYLKTHSNPNIPHLIQWVASVRTCVAMVASNDYVDAKDYFTENLTLLMTSCQRHDYAQPICDFLVNECDPPVQWEVKGNVLGFHADIAYTPKTAPDTALDHPEATLQRNPVCIRNSTGEPSLRLAFFIGNEGAQGFGWVGSSNLHMRCQLLEKAERLIKVVHQEPKTLTELVPQIVWNISHGMKYKRGTAYEAEVLSKGIALFSGRILICKRSLDQAALCIDEESYHEGLFTTELTELNDTDLDTRFTSLPFMNRIRGFIEERQRDSACNETTMACLRLSL